MKCKLVQLFMLGVSLSFSNTLFAVTMIETRQADGSTDKIFIEKSTVRIETSLDSGYILIDGNNKTMLAVSPDEKKIVDMSHMMQPSSDESPRPYKIEFINKGKGPNILGYETRHFEVRVEGQKCGEEYVSAELPKTLGIEQAFEMLIGMPSETEMEIMPGMDICLVVDERITELYAKHGFPMRSLDAKGDVDSEITRIEKNVAMPKGGFIPPANYQTIKMEDMMQDMQNMMQMSPEEMQNMTPEQQEQMQQMMDSLMQQLPRQQ